jgi:hypothetical protein
MGTTIRGDHIVDLVIGNWHPFAVDFDFVVVADHATLGRATIHQVAARALAIVSLEIRVEVLMPFIVAGTIISFLRCYAYTQKHGERAREKRYEVASTTQRFHPKTLEALPFRPAGFASSIPALAAPESEDSRQAFQNILPALRSRLDGT